MTSSLLAKILKARESQVQAGGWTFTIRRPTDWEASQPCSKMDAMRRYVVGWDVKECDVYPGGGGDVAPFDSDAFAAWLEDHAELWGPLADAVSAVYEKRAAALGEAAKN